MKITRNQLRKLIIQEMEREKLINEAGKSYFPKKSHLYRAIIQHLEPTLNYYSDKIKNIKIEKSNFGPYNGIFIELKDKNYDTGLHNWLHIVYNPRFEWGPGNIYNPDENQIILRSAKPIFPPLQPLDYYHKIPLDDTRLFEKIEDFVRMFIEAE